MVMWILQIYIETWLMKKAFFFFSILKLYCEGHHFDRTRFEMVLLHKKIDLELNFKNLH